MSGWTVARIEADRILVRYGATERELLLDFSAPAPPPPEMAMPNDAAADGQAAKSASVQSEAQRAPQSEAEEPEAGEQGQGN